MSYNSSLKILNLALVLEGENFKDLRVVVTDNDGREISQVNCPDEDFPMLTTIVFKPTSIDILRTSASWQKVRVKIDNQVYCVQVEINDAGEPTGRTKAC